MNNNLEKLQNKKTVVTWSGGLDTTCLIPFMIEEYKTKVFPIFVNRGQENYLKEIRAIKYFTDFFSKKYAFNFNQVFEVSTSIPPLEFKRYYPEANIEKINALRNSDIVNQAVRYGLLKNIDTILVGSVAADTFIDNSIVFWQAKTEEIRAGTNNKRLIVIAPFQELKWDKDKLVKWCHENQIPIYASWSCWRDTRYHCGICSPCKRRKEAFRKAKIQDLTVYLE